MEKSVFLKKGKERALLQRHHWIFSGAIAEYPNFENGEILSVYSYDKKLLGHAYFNRKSSIAGRMISFGEASPSEAIVKNLHCAFEMRRSLFDEARTNSYRLVNAEGDQLPGLIIDRYADCVVIQIATLGMERLKERIVAQCVEALKPKVLYEKSGHSSRKEEGLQPIEGRLYGQEQKGDILIRENGLQFYLSLNGQKTGFFLDHRTMRQWIGEHAAGKKVLNCFSYSGAFSVYALAGNASSVTSVDISQNALELAQKNVQLNQLDLEKAPMLACDAFQFLREDRMDYDLVILDPPAFAKKQKDVVAACRGYKDINRLALQKMPPKSLLLTCSCSYHVDAELFQKVVFQAALEANREVRIIGRHRLAADHPINIFHPEGDYLKSLMLYVH